MGGNGVRRKPWVEALRISLVTGLSFGVIFGFIYWLSRGYLLEEGLFYRGNFRTELLTQTARLAMNAAAIAWWISFPGFLWMSVRRARPPGAK